MKLIFVYNADGAFASTIKDTAHKLISPQTYQCNLCRLTYPVAFVQKEWKKFVDSLPHEVSFLHRDEFHKQYPQQKGVPLPAVFTEDASEVDLLIPESEINKAQSIQELISIVKRSLSKEK
ncbi:GTPase [bacterium]|nr:GTPase [bacterium]